MKIAIHHNGKDGFIKYIEGTKEVMVTHPDVKVRNTVRHYLNNERHFVIPGGNEIGNRKVVLFTPNENKRAMVTALSEMFNNTGVHVNWSHKDNEGIEDIDLSSHANAPIAKSMDGNIYKIINGGE